MMIRTPVACRWFWVWMPSTPADWPSRSHLTITVSDHPLVDASSVVDHCSMSGLIACDLPVSARELILWRRH
jgi:hypothetical protein